MRKNDQGFFLIEVVVAASIIATVLIFLLGSIQDSVEASQLSLQRTQASYLLEEGAEAVKGIRDSNWSNISGVTNGTTYYLQWNGSSWSLSTTPQTIDSFFTRSIVFSPVSRDTNDNITTTGGTLDTGTKEVTVTVSWSRASGPASETLSYYLTDFR